MHRRPTDPRRTARRLARPRRIVAFTLALVAIAVLVAACGGSSSPAVAHTGTTTPTATAPTASGSSASAGGGVTVAYSQCMRKHGVPSFPDPNAQGAIVIHASSGSGGSSLNPNSPQYRAAQKDCAKLASGGGTAAQQSQSLTQALKFSACMRSHGVANFPDPTSSNGQIDFNGPPGLGRTPHFLTAQSACSSLLTTTGSGGKS